MGFNEQFNKIPEQQFAFIMKNGKRSSILDGFDFESMTLSSWKFLKETLPDLIKKGNFEKLIIESFRDRGLHYFIPDINQMPFNDILYFIFWIKDELETISNLESTYLVSDTDPDLAAAGVADLNKFGDINTIDSLAGGDVLKWEEVKRLPYHVIFDKQLKNITENSIEKKLLKIKNKPKRNGHS